MFTPLHRSQVEGLLNRCAQRYRIRIYRFANVGNHLHLVVQTQNRNHILARRDLASFLRHFAGTVAMLVSGSRKGASAGKFWDQPVYSRIISWGREFKGVMIYLVKNIFEAAGFWDRKRQPHGFIPLMEGT